MDKKVDSIIILGHDINKKNSREVLTNRIKRALSKFNKNIKKIILSGGSYERVLFFRFGKKGITEAELMKEILLSLKKIPEVKLVLEERSKTTFSNILSSVKLMKKYGLKKALIIGDKKIKRKCTIALARVISGAKDIKLKIAP